MSGDVSRVYQFLAKQGDWVAAADQNNDGVIIKSEFRAFMEENFEWNGEDASAQNDLINSFWKTIDTKTSGSVKGTKLKNLNALDSNEIAAMEDKIKAYEIMNNFIETLQCPTVVADSTNWKKSVTAGLAVKVETFLNNKKSIDELEAYLAEVSPAIENKATADYCANEYLTQVMGDIAKEYGYAYGSDTTLQGIINNYIQNIPEGSSPEDIQQTVRDIIDSYIQTAGLGNGGAADLSAYGYTPGPNTEMNDLQKCVVTAKLKEKASSSMSSVITSAFAGMNLTDEMKANFEKLLLEAVNASLSDYVNGLKFSDFAQLDNIVANFDISTFVTDDMKSGIYLSYYSKELSTILESFAEELVVGIGASTNASFNVYDSTKGDIQLDKDTAKALVKEVNTAGQAFIKTYFAQGGSVANFESALREFVENYLTGKGNQEIKNEASNHSYGLFVSEDELPGYKDFCMNLVAKALAYNNSVKLGSKTVTLENYKDVIDAYTDGDQLMADMETMTSSLDTTNKIYEYVEKARKIVDAEKAEKIKAEIKLIGAALEDLEDSVGSIIASLGRAEMHTEFGTDSKGNIIFQETKTEEVYKALKSKIKSMLSNAGVSLDAIGGTSGLDKLVQAAWIMTYNDFPSSQSNSATSFVLKVMENFKNIMSSLEKNPEYLTLYTQKTAYNNSKFTSGLIHYNTNTTLGNDQKLILNGYSVDENGTVHLANTKDDPDYQATMSALLKRIHQEYDGSLSANVVDDLFQQAQINAINACRNNTHDCPLGTSARGTSLTGQKGLGTGGSSGTNWGGRDYQYNDIWVQDLVEMVLYNFDKLLYAYLAGNA